MKTTALATAAALTAAELARASEVAPSEGIGLLGFVFLGFGALIIVTQLVPAVTLFASMVWGLFTAARGEEATTPNETTKAG